MGRTLIIIVVLIAVIIAAIIIAVQNKSSEVPELLDEFLHSKLATYALNYGIKQIARENVTGTTTQVLNLDVPAVGGRIDTLVYTYNATNDTVSILASISWLENGERKKPAHIQCRKGNCDVSTGLIVRITNYVKLIIIICHKGIDGM